MSLDGYRVEREIHASPRSQIYLVTDSASGERLAMKTPSVNFEDDPAYIERFVMESWIGRRIDHPNVVRVLDGRRAPSALYYLMEYVEGHDARRVAKPPRSGSRSARWSRSSSRWPRGCARSNARRWFIRT